MVGETAVPYGKPRRNSLTRLPALRRGHQLATRTARRGLSVCISMTCHRVRNVMISTKLGWRARKRGIPMMGGYYPDGAGWLMMVLGNVLWIALLAVLVWAVIRWFERRANVPGSPRPGTPESGPSALEILRQRYARGEIDLATFEQMREHLQASGAPDDRPLATNR